MDYDKIAELCEQLSYRDKFRLAQLLIQLARKEEEEKNPDIRKARVNNSSAVEYVAARLMKLKPTKKATLLNSIGAMFQFQGGISDEDKEAIVDELQKRNYLVIDSKGHVSYKT
ncbi:MAG: hypothetical protein ACKPH1_20765 [Microcystis panniformis]